MRTILITSSILKVFNWIIVAKVFAFGILSRTLYGANKSAVESVKEDKQQACP